MTRWRRNDAGATALLVAIMSLLLFSMGAMAVDLGNAFARKRDTQAQADFAALAGGAKLPSASGLASACPSSPPAFNDPVVAQVVSYLNANKTTTDAGTSTVTASQLVDCDLTNGEVTFPTKDKVTVYTPRAQVNFGLANLMGFSSTKVQSRATVEIKSPGSAVMPVYAVAGCDYGPQTITDPAAGQATPVAVPTLADYDGQTNGVTLTAISTNPTPVPLNASGYTVTLEAGKNEMAASTVDKVGFFRASGSAPPTLVTVNTVPANFTSSGTKTYVTITIPSTVASVEALWYLRVHDKTDATGGLKWSSRADAQPLRIGNAVLECAGIANDGNFGTLKIPRQDIQDATTNGWLPTNMALGLQPPLSLAVYPNPATAPTTCGPPPAVTSDKDNLRPGTNCVDTDTGLPANSTTSGLVTGVSLGQGRLDRGTTAGCGANSADRNARWDTGIKRSRPGNYTINDDLLTCFFTDSTTTVNDIIQPMYNGGSKLSTKIFSSPRFMWVPVLKAQPLSGSSQMYSIVDFRPAFLTDQPLTASRGNMTLGTSTGHNGLTINNSSIETAKVIFFNIKALPETTDGSMPTTPYLGFGTKVITLVD